MHDITERTPDRVRAAPLQRRLRGRFAAVAAHDLRTPLVTLSGARAAPWARERCRRKSARPKLSRATSKAAAAHACRLVDGLDRSPTYRAHRTPDARLVDLERLAADLLATLHPTIEEAGARVELCALPTVMGDGGGLSRVLQNLVVNAIKYRGPDPPRILIEAQRGDGTWIVSVRDNGAGIRDGDRERIFEIFARARSEDDEVDGTGLGLAVCQTIIEHHGGRIWVEPPRPAGGSAFASRCPSGRVSPAGRSTVT